MFRSLSEFKACHYKPQGYGNRSDFIDEVKAKRAKRAAHKKWEMDSQKKFSPPAERYATNPYLMQNIHRLKNIIHYVIGHPSHTHFEFRAGKVDAKYLGATSFYQKGSKWKNLEHCFQITTPRQLVIEERSFDGLLNIYCKKVRMVGNVTVYKATWIVKQRGYSFYTESGYIGVIDEFSFHGKTVKEVVNGVIAKLKRKVKLTKSITPDSVISKDEFHKITNACNTGIENFCATHNVVSDKMKVSDILSLLDDTGQRIYAENLRKALALSTIMPNRGR